MGLTALLRESRVIPAIRDIADIDAAIASPSRIVYVLTGDVAGIAAILERLHAGAKIACVNLDLVEGLAGDSAAVRYLSDHGADGVISTHAPVLRAAQQQNIFAIQRSFVLDSQALAKTCRSIERFVPDAVEVLPAPVAPRVLPAIREVSAALPVIAGGLIATLVEIDALVSAGVDAVSVSAKRLWVM